MNKNILIIITILIIIGGFFWFAKSNLSIFSDTIEESGNTSEVHNMSKEDELKILFSEKYNKKESEITIIVDQETKSHVRGRVMFEPIENGNSGMFIAVKTENNWQLLHDGQGSYSCSLIEPYDFPIEMVGDCYQ